MDQNRRPSTFSTVIGLIKLGWEVSSDFGIKRMRPNLHLNGILRSFQIRLKILSRIRKTLGHLLYTRYPIPLNPGEELLRFFEAVAVSSLKVGADKLNAY